LFVPTLACLSLRVRKGGQAPPLRCGASPLFGGGAWAARRKLKERFAALLPHFNRLGMVPRGLIVRPLKRRWGSLSANGRMTLNRDLVRAPTACIDYVIVHELCHLVLPHHGRKFYAVLRRVMPDWEKRKARLERTLA